jgi:hypothetical protein
VTASSMPALSKGNGSSRRLTVRSPMNILEACFCQFEAPSAAVVAEANRRASLRFDRIVAADSIAAAGLAKPTE